ncbi:protein of unknown function [Methylocaldum szegediense]|uniref:Uncharacterized protein n=1 Tax=Methylocaldum szegediense TaxID=73780 RepID=A0ABM9I1E2_9GAMM|nr:protein of unknown function [Methylocaldum szegediense]
MTSFNRTAVFQEIRKNPYWRTIRSELGLVTHLRPYVDLRMFLSETRRLNGRHSSVAAPPNRSTASRWLNRIRVRTNNRSVGPRT